MEEILYQLIGGLSHFYPFLGFQPSFRWFIGFRNHPQLILLVVVDKRESLGVSLAKHLRRRQPHHDAVGGEPGGPGWWSFFSAHGDVRKIWGESDEQRRVFET